MFAHCARYALLFAINSVYVPVILLQQNKKKRRRRIKKAIYMYFKLWEEGR
jgi:hypothetical protein